MLFSFQLVFWCFEFYWCLMQTICTMFLLQSIRKPVLDEDASMGKYLAGGRDLLVHVTPLPYPLCGTATSKCMYLTLIPELGDRAKTCLELKARDGVGRKEVTLGFSFRLSSRSHLWMWHNGWWYWKSHYLSFCWMKRLNMWPVTTWNLVKIVCGLPPNRVLCQHAPKEFPGRLCSLLCPWLSGFTVQTLTLVICSGLDWHGDKFYIQRKSLT